MMKSQHENGPKNLQNGAPEGPPGTEGKNIFFGFWVVRWPLGRQEGPKSTQEAPKTPLRGPKAPQEAPRRAPRGSRRGLKRLLRGSLEVLWKLLEVHKAPQATILDTFIVFSASKRAPEAPKSRSINPVDVLEHPEGGRPR